MIRQLPVFEGSTVDERLRQFRKTPNDGMPECIDFDSLQGRRLLIASIATKLIEGDLWVMTRDGSGSTSAAYATSTSLGRRSSRPGLVAWSQQPDRIPPLPSARRRPITTQPLPLLSGGGRARVQRGGAAPAMTRPSGNDGGRATSRIGAGRRGGD